MQQTHGNYIKGLSIATIVCAGLGILGVLIGLFGLGLVGTILGAAGPGSLDTAYSYGYTHGYDYYYDMDDYEAMMLITGIGGFFCILALICCAVLLVAGIIGVRNANNPAKLGQVFGWSIAGAVVSLFFGGIVTLVLEIIVAVFAYKDRNLYRMQQAGYAPQAVAPAAAPVAPAAAPAPGAPAAPAPAAAPQPTPAAAPAPQAATTTVQSAASAPQPAPAAQQPAAPADASAGEQPPVA